MGKLKILWRGCEKLVARMDMVDAACLKLSAASAGVLLGLGVSKKHRGLAGVLAALTLAAAFPILALEFFDYVGEACQEAAGEE